MPNRNLSPTELELANELLAKIRLDLGILSGEDQALHFAYRRKIHKELGYDERGKPTHRRILKLKKMVEQNSLCAHCNEPLPEKYAVLDRLNAIEGYTKENTRLIHQHCDTEIQQGRGYT